VDASVNIHNPLTALLCFGTTHKIDSSNYTINSCLNSRVVVWTSCCRNV